MTDSEHKARRSNRHYMFAKFAMLNMCLLTGAFVADMFLRDGDIIKTASGGLGVLIGAWSTIIITYMGKGAYENVKANQ